MVRAILCLPGRHPEGLRERRGFIPSLYPDNRMPLLNRRFTARLDFAEFSGDGGDRAQSSELLAALPIALDDETPGRALREVLPLARRRRLLSYDAAYLELAMRRGLALASGDGGLRAAAAAAGVALFVSG